MPMKWIYDQLPLQEKIKTAAEWKYWGRNRPYIEVEPIAALDALMEEGPIAAPLNELHRMGLFFLFVGGAVRDTYLGGLESKDVDTEVYGITPETLEAILGRYGRVDAVGRKFGVLKFSVDNKHFYDFSVPRRENRMGAHHRDFAVQLDLTITPEDAARRRDFTMNALGYNPVTQEVHDYLHGREHIDIRMLVPTGQAFMEDALRVLRGMQFSCRFKMGVSPYLRGLALQMKPDYAELSDERIREEWLKWALRGLEPGRAISYLSEVGWLDLYPELEAIAGVPQDPIWHPEGWLCRPIAFDVASSSLVAGMAKSSSSNVSLREVVKSAQGPPAVIAKPASFVWSFGNSAFGADESVRVVFQIPLSSMGGIMDSALNDFEIFQNVVRGVAVYVMNVLPPFQGSTELHFHQDAVDSEGAVAPGAGGVKVTSGMMVYSGAPAVDGNVFFSVIFSKGDVDVHNTSIQNLPTYEVITGGVHIHTMHVCDAAARIAERDRMQDNERTILLLAALCHDLAKATTTELREKEGVMHWTAYGHEKAGAELAMSFLHRIGMTHEVISAVVPLVANHLAHVDFQRAASEKRVVRRLARRLFPASIETLVALIEADMSGRPPLPQLLPEGAVRLQQVAVENSVLFEPQKPLLQGRDVLPYFDNQPGKHIGLICQLARQEQEEGNISTHGEALVWLKDYMANLALTETK